MRPGARDSQAPRIGVSWLRADDVAADRCVRAVLEFGIRSEVNVYVGEREARVTGAIQKEICPLLA